MHMLAEKWMNDEVNACVHKSSCNSWLSLSSKIWEAESSEISTTIQERGNVDDQFVVAVKKH